MPRVLAAFTFSKIPLTFGPTVDPKPAKHANASNPANSDLIVEDIAVGHQIDEVFPGSRGPFFRNQTQINLTQCPDFELWGLLRGTKAGP